MSSYEPSMSQIEDGVAVTLALSAVRRYYYNVPGYSAYCLLGGLAAMEAIRIGQMLPSSVNAFFSKASAVGSPGQVAAALVGGVSLELAVQGSLDVADVSSVSGAERIIIGAGATLAGIWVADKVKKMMSS